MNIQQPQDPIGETLLSPEDNALLEKFFAEYKQDVPDDGFILRTVNALPTYREAGDGWITTVIVIGTVIAAISEAFHLAVTHWSEVIQFVVMLAVRVSHILAPTMHHVTTTMHQWLTFNNLMIYAILFIAAVALSGYTIVHDYIKR